MKKIKNYLTALGYTPRPSNLTVGRIRAWLEADASGEGLVVALKPRSRLPARSIDLLSSCPEIRFVVFESGKEPSWIQVYGRKNHSHRLVPVSVLPRFGGPDWGSHTAADLVPPWDVKNLFAAGLKILGGRRGNAATIALAVLAAKLEDERHSDPLRFRARPGQEADSVVQNLKELVPDMWALVAATGGRTDAILDLVRCWQPFRFLDEQGTLSVELLSCIGELVFDRTQDFVPLPEHAGRLICDLLRPWIKDKVAVLSPVPDASLYLLQSASSPTCCLYGGEVLQDVAACIMPGVSVTTGGLFETGLPWDVDLFFINPPFGHQISSHTFPQHPTSGKPVYELTGKKKKPIEALVLEQVLHSVKPDGGRIAALLPDGFLSNLSLRHVREWLLQQCRVVAVISLPDRTFESVGLGIKMSFVILQRGVPKEDYPIFMAELSDLSAAENGEGAALVEVFHSFLKDISL